MKVLEPELQAVPGTVSIWYGRPDATPSYARNEQATHYAASTMKVAVMAAAYRRAEAGTLDLDAEVEVHEDFDSATGLGRFENHEDYDHDDQVWTRLGRTAPLRWLIRRMIVMSGNLATNLVLERVGLESVGTVWALAGAEHSKVSRGIEDFDAADAGFDNLVTASDLARLFAALRAGRLAGPEATAEMLEVLFAQEVDEDVVRGLPPGTRVAHKNGWVEGVRHSAALVVPDDAPEFVLVSCVSAPLDERAGCDLIARIAEVAWAGRHGL